MKQKTQSKLTQEKVYVVDGPPIDFSFKSIRNIQCTSNLIQNLSLWIQHLRMKRSSKYPKINFLFPKVHRNK